MHSCIVGDDLCIEIGAVKLVSSLDLLPNVDLCHKRSAENLLDAADRLSPHAVFLDDVRENIVVLFKGTDRPDDVVVMFHYSHGDKF